MEKRVLVKKDVEKRIHKEGAKRQEKKVAEKEEAARSADKRASQKGLQNMRASQTRGRGDEEDAAIFETMNTNRGDL